MSRGEKGVFIGAVCILLLCAGFGIWPRIGVSAANLERDARKSQKIDERWAVQMSVTGDLAALLFYDEASSAFTYSIYTKRDGFSFGYFFRNGGSTSTIGEGIHAFQYHGVTAYLSMNQGNAARFVFTTEDGISEGEEIRVTPGEPFAITHQHSGGDETLYIYDADGAALPISVISSV